jgi:hypothetical protein
MVTPAASLVAFIGWRLDEGRAGQIALLPRHMNFLRRFIGVIGVVALAWAGASRPVGHLTPYTDTDEGGVAIGDVDCDGTADHAELERDRYGLRLRLSLSGEDAPERLRVDGDSLTIAALDLDNDNDLDVLVVSRGGRITVFYNQGNGQFWPKELPIPYRAGAAASVGSLTLAVATSAPPAPILASSATIAAFAPSITPSPVVPAAPPTSSRTAVALRGPPASLHS